MTRFQTPSAVYGIILKDDMILLQKRKGGVFHGLYDVAVSGHVDPFEKMSAAIIRETKEEIGIDITKSDISFSLLMHSYYDGAIYYNGYFHIEHFLGTPQLMEPDKASELKYFKLSDLPENMIPDRRHALKAILNGQVYTEYGWFTN